MKEVKDFLQKNGFAQDEENQNHYVNGNCSILIEKDHYAVANASGDAIYSNGLNIYWLIGVLTYYGYMHKHYEQ
jgi:hypothetical protein